MKTAMNILIYIIVNILYGVKELFVGLLIIAAIFAFFAALVLPPMASFHSFVDGDIWYGSLWLIATLFVYGTGFRMSNHG